MKKKLIAGNWKMNGSLAANEALVKALLAGLSAQPCEVALCVPAVYLAQLQALVAGSRIELGAQDISMHESGAYTGEVSAAMLKEFGVRYAIVGHSERRQYHGETDQLVAAKAKTALASGVTPIVCVGETLAEREDGHAEAVVGQQLSACREVLLRAQGAAILAYEPVWAIGTGKTATPAEAQAMHAFIRATLRVLGAEAEATSILYGGSVKAGNARELFSQADIDGGLIGGASLVAADFLAIAAAL